MVHFDQAYLSELLSSSHQDVDMPYLGTQMSIFSGHRAWAKESEARSWAHWDPSTGESVSQPHMIREAGVSTWKLCSLATLQLRDISSLLLPE